MKDSFLDSFKLFSRWTAFFAFNNFTFPKSHAKKINIKIKMFEKVLMVLKLCAFFGIIITNNVLLRKTQKTAATTSITGYVVVLLNVTGISIFLTNLFIEVRHHSNIWAIISGFCDVDNMVSYLSYIRRKQIDCFILTFMKMKRLDAKSKYKSNYIAIVFICFIYINLIGMNATDFYQKFSFKLNIITFFYYLTAIWTRSIMLTMSSIFAFFSFHIYIRYRLINERFR